MKLRMIKSVAGAERGINFAYGLGEIIDIESVGARSLLKAKYAVPVKEEKEKAVQKKSLEKKIVHVGGGWYELPNGERIRGKENALRAKKEGS